MDNLVWIFFSGLVINNFTLYYFLGLCPFFGVTSKFETAWKLGLANIFVMLIAAVSDSAWRKVPPASGKWRAAASAISLAGVIGYP